jgi:peptidoglycan glycosyltransferase
MKSKKLIKNPPPSERPSWKIYQEHLKRSHIKKKSIKNSLKIAGVFFVFLFLAYFLLGRLTETSSLSHLTDDRQKLADDTAKPNISIDKLEVQTLLNSEAFINLKEKSFEFTSDGLKYRVDTSLDIPLQNFLIKNLNLSTSRYIAIVVMDPVTGRILSMVGFDRNDPSNNPCVDNRFPAASIFKIVTASAAIEKFGLNADSEFTYNGNKYTLYKSQLKNRRNSFSNTISLGDSFAQSVNPVFGKIGVYYLGKASLENYATAFGFNRNINFEIELAPSRFSIEDNPYDWAEIACGFNRKTKISPLHGAIITSAILNRGQLLEPTIVDRIMDQDGRVLYRSRRTLLNRAVSAQVSEIVNDLMETTIISGTCKKAFRNFGKDRVLSKLNIGAKSGSIYNASHDTRYDWFVGFAEQKEGPAKIVISAVVGHQKYIGTRASYYARIAIKEYFRNYFSENHHL